MGFVQAGLGLALVDALLPWAQFAGIAVRPLAASPTVPLALLSVRNRPLSQAETRLRDHLRQTCRALPALSA
ncbi:hypothetical protein [Rhodovulum kholense]|uniref:LysR substrate binding domain-containing protein n=1 Tax=Rhodovulum kholense TaxID=453584 RepID=A0A8E2VKJ1_9RHOB|nr:hypothetical protein [Rhodovulum kholense]PTW47759.1 LysR substrate binding domain-containing protein [Rhodovulum kholense]